MKTELELYLKKNFPDIYNTSDKDTSTFKGFNCGDGWFRLILWLSRYLKDYIVNQNKASDKMPEKYLPVKPIKVLSVDKNRGIIKFNIKGGNERIYSVISFAEYISGFICEETGKIDNIVYNKNTNFKTLHHSLINSDSFEYVDEKPLREILTNQLEFTF